MQHHIYLLINGGELCEAPIPPQLDRVLDIGCGTGKWAIDFADHHPEAEVLATDLSVIQPYWVSEYDPPRLRAGIGADSLCRFLQMYSSKLTTPKKTGNITASLITSTFDPWAAVSAIGRV